MLRLSTLKATLFTISKKNKTRVLNIINLLIFVTFFALFSSTISIYFERKIDLIEKKNIISEFNNLIFSNQIERTSSNIKFTDKVLDKYFEDESFRHILFKMSSDDLRLFNEREKYYDQYFVLQKRASVNNDEIKRSIGDAMMIAQTPEDVENVEKYNEKYFQLKQVFSEILTDQNMHRSKNSPEDDDAKIIYDTFFKEYDKFNKSFINLLSKQSQFFLDFNIEYFNQKKNNSESEIKKSLLEIQELSKKESQFILFAFLVQVIIFVTVQIFELTFEYQNRKKQK